MTNKCGKEHERELALLLVFALSACNEIPSRLATAGDRLEAAAQDRGLVADPQGSLVGAWGRDTDRVCVVSAADGTSRIGALVDYGDGNACAARGTLERAGERVRVQLGECRFDARFDGDRLTFPAELPSACAQACTGRATLVALAVERLGSSMSEAATLRSADGQLLCGT